MEQDARDGRHPHGAAGTFWGGRERSTVSATGSVFSDATKTSALASGGCRRRRSRPPPRRQQEDRCTESTAPTSVPMAGTEPAPERFDVLGYGHPNDQDGWPTEGM